MKTARIPIQNESTGKKEYLTVLFDTGAKRTYITERNAKRLQLAYQKYDSYEHIWEYKPFWDDDTKN